MCNQNDYGQYEAEMYAAAAQAEYEHEMDYQRYLSELLENKQERLFAIHIALDILKSAQFATSRLNPVEYLEQIRNDEIKLIELKKSEPNKENNNIAGLPF